MSELQVMEIRFRGERLGSYVDNIGVTWTLFRLDAPYEGYRIHRSDEDGAWIEPCLEDWQVLRDWPAFSAFLLA